MQHLREVEGWQPDVHARSTTGTRPCVANYLKTYYAYTFGHIATVFTIHNLAYQGQFSPVDHVHGRAGRRRTDRKRTGPAHRELVQLHGARHPVQRHRQHGQPHVCAGDHDVASTASDWTRCCARRDRVAGILNGIEPRRTTRATDPHCRAIHADDRCGQSRLQGGAAARTGLPGAPDRRCWASCRDWWSRRGSTCCDQVVPWLVAQTDAQLVLLGSGQAHLEDAFRRHARRHPIASPRASASTPRSRNASMPAATPSSCRRVSSPAGWDR